MSLWKNNGFSLIEVMIAIAIVAILASIAYPSYISYLTSSRRTEAMGALQRFANVQEQFYSDHQRYAKNMAELGFADPYVSENGHYQVVTNSSSLTSDFTLTASAQGVQATNDADCKELKLQHNGIRTATSGDCWE